jgi:hypothetical protein
VSQSITDEFPGYVEWLSDGISEFPVFVLSADTDMPLLGIGCLTSVAVNEIVLARMEVSELKGDPAARSLFESRVNTLLGRGDLRVVPLLRVDDVPDPKDVSFREWMVLRKPPQPIYGSIVNAGAEARSVATMAVPEYRSRGGLISWATAV